MRDIYNDTRTDEEVFMDMAKWLEWLVTEKREWVRENWESKSKSK